MIAERLKMLSQEVLHVGELAHPAPQRLLNGWVKAEWGASENNRVRAAHADRRRKEAARRRTRRVRAVRVFAIQRVLEMA
jgi:hypothetical protein